MIRTTTIGCQVFKYLKEETQGSVVGVTSAGTFIKTPANKILFLTTGPYRGPLTLNLEGDSNIFDQFENGMDVVMGAGEISIPAVAFRIQTANADIWSPPLPQAPLRSPEERREALRAFAGEMLSFIKEQDTPAIYAWLKAIARGDTLPDAEPGSLFAAIQVLHQKAKAGDLPGAREAVHLLLGRGEGLTPAGDDLLLGWLLALNRWREALDPDLDRHPLNQAILIAAFEKTTTLSANLLVCAAEGEADERLYAALDAVMCEENSHVGVQHAEPLLSWGRSSGMYAFLGMGAAVLAT
jgi:hypothetical protein